MFSWTMFPIETSALLGGARSAAAAREFAFREMFIVTSCTRLTGLLAVVSTSILMGCSHKPIPLTRAGGASRLETVAITSQNDAVRRSHRLRGAMRFTSAAEEHLMARREPLKYCLEQVKSSLQPEEMKDCIVFGELSSLSRAGECWIVEVDQGVLGGQIAYIDDAGRLLLAWRASEG